MLFSVKAISAEVIIELRRQKLRTWYNGRAVSSREYLDTAGKATIAFEVPDDAEVVEYTHMGSSKFSIVEKNNIEETFVENPFTCIKFGELEIHILQDKAVLGYTCNGAYHFDM